LQIEDKIYYLRVVMAAIAGSILGAIVKPNSDQSNTIGLTILVGIIFYAVSQIIATRMAGDLPKEKKKKIITIAIFGFIFMLLTFMVLTYTVLNQHII
jgi:membrane protein insertase Oxa1/YidC/SpoIIIJ